MPIELTAKEWVKIKIGEQKALVMSGDDTWSADDIMLLPKLQSSLRVTHVQKHDDFSVVSFEIAKLTYRPIDDDGFRLIEMQSYTSSREPNLAAPFSWDDCLCATDKHRAIFAPINKCTATSLLFKLDKARKTAEQNLKSMMCGIRDSDLNFIAADEKYKNYIPPPINCSICGDKDDVDASCPECKGCHGEPDYDNAPLGGIGFLGGKINPLYLRDFLRDIPNPAVAYDRENNRFYSKASMIFAV